MRFDYTFAPINNLAVQTEQDGKAVKVLVDGESLEPTDRFWTSLFSRYGFNSAFFKFFGHAEVFNRIAAVEKNDKLRLCIERGEEGGPSRLLAVSNPNKPIIKHDDLMDTLGRYGGQDLRYSDGVVESTHLPRVGTSSFDIAGDEFSNRFVLSAPIDGYGLPNVYLSLLRHICTNGAVGYAKAFRSSLSVGRGADDVRYSIVRALEGFNNEDGYAALRQRFDSAAKSWASVNEAQSLYKHLIRLLANNQIGWDGAATTGEGGIQRLFRQNVGERTEADEIGSPILSAFHRLTGDPSRLYGLANIDALSIKRQRTLPVRCRTYDLINFASEVATHHATTQFAARSTQAWLGSLISGEYDLENSADSYSNFADFFIERKVDGEAATDLQKIGS